MQFRTPSSKRGFSHASPEQEAFNLILSVNLAKMLSNNG